MTWLDWYVQDRAESVRTLFRSKGWPLPRTPDGSMNAATAFADAITMSLLEYSANCAKYEAEKGNAKRTYENNLLSCCLLPFLNGFVPAARRVDSLVSGPGLGLLLTRDTADMLADAAPPVADPWRRRMFGPRSEGAGLGGVHVDVPHGALRISTGLQVRAIVATPWRGLADEADERSEVVQTGSILLAIVVTARDSNRPHGLLFAAVDEQDRVRMVSMPDATTAGFLNDDPEEPGAGTSAEPIEIFRPLYERTVGLFCLVLAYHHHGPVEVITHPSPACAV